MKYRGYDIRPVIERLPSIGTRPATAIFLGDKQMALTKDPTVAKHVVDMKLKTGEWKEQQP